MTIAVVALLIAAAVAAVESIVGTLLVERLGDVEPLESTALPAVTVVVAARNEADHVADALRSVLAQDHAALDVVFVDDRSDDGTGAIASAMATEDPRLRVVRVDTLPAGWLGKNHALNAGAAAASGDWLLFTDADVEFEATAVRRALTAATFGRLDMLACAPRITSPSPAVRLFVAGFAIFFGLYVRTWRVRSPRSQAAVGIGAFNLVRAVAYRAAGGHMRLRLRPDDDLALGKAVKQAGGRCDMRFAGSLVRVAWYPSLRALVQGLMKNTFAGLGYRLSMAAAGVAGLLVVGVVPFVLAVLVDGPLGLAAIGVSLTVGVAAILATRAADLPGVYGLGLPLSSLLFAYIVVRATILTLGQGGIYWRGTFYPLNDLRQNRL